MSLEKIQCVVFSIITNLFSHVYSTIDVSVFYFIFQLFDHCLAPNTMGDGTGCDNMTCIIVVLNRPSTTGTKRNCDHLDTSTTEEQLPEKRTKLDEPSESGS